MTSHPPARALVIGQGSIGQRHARLLTELGSDVAVVSGQSGLAYPTYGSVGEGLKDWLPGYVVVANATVDHMPTIQSLAAMGYRGRLLVEKPLTAKAEPFPADLSPLSRVGFNLRFHPVLQGLKSRLVGHRALQLSIHCGQHLADWRPGRDFRSSYSAHAGQGGGVLRDLSHDLDYLLWLAGPWRRVSAVGGNLGVLGIDADEAWSILIELANGATAVVTLNYIDRPARRQIHVTTGQGAVTADLVKGRLEGLGDAQDVRPERDATYLAMHRAMFQPTDNPDLCDVEQAQAVDRLVLAIEKAAKTKAWVENE